MTRGRTWLTSIYETLESVVPHSFIHGMTQCFQCSSAEHPGACEEIPIKVVHRKSPTHCYTPTNTYHTPDGSHSLHNYLDHLFHRDVVHVRHPNHNLEPHYIFRDGHIFKTLHVSEE